MKLKFEIDFLSIPEELETKEINEFFKTKLNNVLKQEAYVLMLKIKRCDYCHSLFYAEHGKKKYCSNCKKSTVWSRRQKEKAEEK